MFDCPADETPDQSLQHAFHDSTEPEEIERELKLLTKDGSNDPFYAGVTPFLFNRGMLIHSAADPQQIVASQRDTFDMELLAQDITLRLRGSSKTGNLEDIDRSDICIKIPYDKKGGLARREYEEVQSSFFEPEFDALRKKYGDPAKFPDLHATLDSLEGKEVPEFFRVDVIRERHIIKVPNDAVGLRDDQAFYGELLYDRVRYVIDQEDMDETWVLNPHCEMELEPLKKVCPWNEVSGAENYICKNLSTEDRIRCLEWFKKLIMDEAAPGQFFETSQGKAERGFQALMHFAAEILEQQQRPVPLKEKIAAMFHKAAAAMAPGTPVTRVLVVKPEEISESEKPVALRHRLPPPQAA